MTNQSSLPVEAKTGSNRNKILIAVAAAVVILLCCCCLIVGVVLVVDPFDWQLLGRFTGKGDAAAAAMPTDTVIYMGVNLLNVTPEKLDRVISPFQKIMAEETGEQVTTLDDIKTQINEEFLVDLDMTVEEDILPWIGQYIGLGVSNIQMGDYGGLEMADILVSVEARDKDAADAFLMKLKTKITESSGSGFVEMEHQGVTIATLNASSEDERISIAHSGNLLLFSNQETLLQKSIDSLKGDGMDAAPMYKQLMGKLPADRILGIYISGDHIDELTQIGSQAMGGITSLGEGYQFLDGLALSLSVVEAGVQLDTMMAYDPDQMTEEQKKLTNTMGSELELPKMLPAGTVMYIGGNHLDLVWLANKSTLGQTAGMGEDITESMNMFAQQYGFNPDTDLFPYLDGEWGLAVIPANTGVLAQSMNVFLGGLLVAETSNTDKISGVVSGFSSSMLEMGLQFEDVTVGSDTLKQATDPSMGPMFTFGLSQKRLVIATSSDVVEATLNTADPLSKSDRYQQVLKALSGGINPVVYLDLEKMLGDIRSGLTPDMQSSFEEAIMFLEPVQYLVMGSSPLQNNVAHGVAILFIK